jgi:hypothetical protein
MAAEINQVCSFSALTGLASPLSAAMTACQDRKFLHPIDILAMSHTLNLDQLHEETDFAPGIRPLR